MTTVYCNTRFLVAAATLFFSFAAAAQDSEDYAASSPLDNLDWQTGPARADITNRAEISFPAGYDYLGTGDTKTLMELMENPSSGEEYYVGREDMQWFAIFEYEDTGYVKDDDTIDPGELLDSIRDSNDASNEFRRERGWGEMRIVGWAYEPFYEPESNRLAWAILAEADGEQVVNYNTRILGRTGVMSVMLVSSPATLSTDVEEFKQLLAGFDYKSGDSYGEYRSGDKLAAYGLAALVAGGAATAVAKSGALKGFFKFILAGVLAFFAFVWSFVKRLLGRNV